MTSDTRYCLFKFSCSLTLCALLGTTSTRAQAPLPWPVATQYNHGVAQWNTIPGMLYRMERTTDFVHWTPLPERYYGYGLPVTQRLHADFYPDLGTGVTAQTVLVRPPAVSPPAMPTGSTTPVAVVEGLLTQDSLVQVNGSWRELDLTMLLRLRNRGAVAAPHVQANLFLPYAFANLLSGPTPAAVLSVSPAVDVKGSLTPNLGFNGSTDPRLLTGDDSLPAYAAGEPKDEDIATLRVTLHFSFAGAGSVPRTERYLYALLSSRAAGNNPGAMVWSTSTGLPTPPPGDVSHEPTAYRFNWRTFGSPNYPSTSPVYFYQHTEVFQRTFQITGFSDGSMLAAWYSPPENAIVSRYFGLPIFDLTKPTAPGQSQQYYQGFASVRRDYPTAGPGVDTLPDIPTFGCPTRVDLDVVAFGSHNPATPGIPAGRPTAAQQAYLTVPASEELAWNLFLAQRNVLRQRLIAQATPPPAIIENPADLTLTDHDLTKKKREFFRVRAYDIDSNFNGEWDSTELTHSDGWLSNLDEDGDRILNGYDEYATAAGKSVIINEFCAINGGAFKDNNEAKPSWIELYNISNA